MQQMHRDLFSGISVLLFVSEANLDASPSFQRQQPNKIFPQKLDNFAPERKVLMERKPNINEIQESSVSSFEPQRCLKIGKNPEDPGEKGLV